MLALALYSWHPGQAVGLLAIGAIVALSAALLPIGLKTGECHVVSPALIALVLTLIVLVGFLILIAFKPLVLEATATQATPS